MMPQARPPRVGTSKHQPPIRGILRHMLNGLAAGSRGEIADDPSQHGPLEPHQEKKEQDGTQPGNNPHRSG